MKFTNSSVYNKQHFFAMACIVVVLSAGVILVAISNEPCEQGLSAEKTLRRRLRTHENFFTDKEGRSLSDKSFDNKLPQLVEAVEVPSKPVQVDEATGKQPEQPEGQAEQKPVQQPEQHVTVKNTHLLASKWMAAPGIASIALIPVCWAFLLHGNKTDGVLLTNDVACLGGCFTTVMFLCLWVLILSQNGHFISTHFGVNGNGFIVLSSACVLFSGVSLSCITLCPPATYVFGALAIGSVVACLLFKFFKNPISGKKLESYVGTGLVSALTTIGAGYLIFGLHTTENSEALIETAVSVFEFVGLIALLWVVFKLGAWCRAKYPNAGK